MIELLAGWLLITEMDALALEHSRAEARKYSGEYGACLRARLPTNLPFNDQRPKDREARLRLWEAIRADCKVERSKKVTALVTFIGARTAGKSQAELQRLAEARAHEWDEAAYERYLESKWHIGHPIPIVDSAEVGSN